MPPVDQPLTESTKQYPEVVKTAPVKTYGSKNKDTAPSAKATERASDTSGKSRSTDAQDEQTSRNRNASKRRKVVGSDSELSDAGHEAGDVRQTNKNPGNAAKEDIAEAPVSTKRTSKKRAIIASDDETEEEELHTPDSKRRKPESEAQRNPSKTSRPRDSSIDPLDLDMDNGFSGKSARMEVSIEMSPASLIDLHSSNRAPAEVENPTSVKSKTKSPNKVHFVDPPAEEEEPVVKQPSASKSKKSKSVSRMDDAYDEAPEFAAPVEDENEEDDFVPSGSKKAKAKAKATKAKKATAAKEKAVKGKKATQVKGKKGKVVEPVQPSFTEESFVEASEAPTVSDVNENPTTENATAPAPTVPEVVETPPGASAKGNPKRIVVVGKKAPKSAEIIEDEEPTMPEASADVVPDTVPIAAPVPDEPEAVKEDAVVAMTGRGTRGKKAAARKKVVESDVESEKEVEKETTPPVAAQPSVVSHIWGFLLIQITYHPFIQPAAKVLQPNASLAVNPPAGVKLEPSFVVDKNGNVKEFRTCQYAVCPSRTSAHSRFIIQVVPIYPKWCKQPAA